VKLFPNLAAALKGVFRTRANSSPTVSEPSNVPAAHVELNVLCSSCRAQRRRRGRLGGALRAAAKTGLAIELIRLVCALSHGTIAARSARPAAYQPARLRAPGKTCHEGAQARTAALEQAALMRIVSIVKQVRATLGDALSLWADFITHANACYIVHATPSYGPSVALFPEPRT